MAEREPLMVTRDQAETIDRVVSAMKKTQGYVPGVGMDSPLPRAGRRGSDGDYTVKAAAITALENDYVSVKFLDSDGAEVGDAFDVAEDWPTRGGSAGRAVGDRVTIARVAHSDVETGDPAKDLKWIIVSGAGDAVPRQIVFTSNGSWTVPAGVTRIEGMIVGGGGRGGAAGADVTKFVADGDGSVNLGKYGGGGGGSGATKLFRAEVAPGEDLTITVGAGGSSGTPAGGDSSVAGLGADNNITITSNGGAAGGNGTTISPGLGGAGGSGTALANQTTPNYAFFAQSSFGQQGSLSNNGTGGKGGESILAGGGSGPLGTGTRGSGGAGANQNGGTGIVVLWY